jgi:2Fe-2S ferredoxin
VIVDDAWADKLPPKQTMEADMVEFVADPQPTSRLSCQLTITDGLDGLTLRLPSKQA